MGSILTYNGKILTSGGKWIENTQTGLPGYTIRLLYPDGYTPVFARGRAVQIMVSPNIWELTYEMSNWAGLLSGYYNRPLLEVLAANTTGVTRMVHLFNDCRSLRSVALFDTSAVTDMYQMFRGCETLTEVPLFDTGNCTNFVGMFMGCESLTTVPNLDLRKATTLQTMFSGCTSLVSIPALQFSNVTTNVYGMFYTCTSLTTLPYLYLSNVTNMGYLCYGCSSLQSIPSLYPTKVTNASHAFEDCINVASGSYSLYTRLAGQTTPPSTHYDTFKNCGTNTVSGAAELARIPSDWKE